jgi:hypothetical protein
MGQTGRALTRRATQLPLSAISLGLEAWERSRGLREFGFRRANEALQIAAHTPLGRLLPQQLLDDGADEEAARIATDAREATAPKPAAQKPAAQKPAAQKPAAQKPAAPTQPPAAETEAARAVGAPGAVTHEVEQITEQLHAQAPQTRDELPIPDFDNISIGSLRARLRALSVEQLVVLREWEQSHANRLNVITTLDNRIAKLAEAPSNGNAAANGAATSPTTSPGGSTAGSNGQTDVGPSGTDYPQEAKTAERAAEDEGGTLRV